MKHFFLIVIVFVLAGRIAAQTADTEILMLSGADAGHTVEWDFFCSAGMKSSVWTKIAVPSCWEQQGFGSYNYGHDDFSKRVNETGLYRHKFTLPASWKGKDVQIVFEGVMTDALVKVNGKQAGAVHQGAFYRFSYDITKLLQFGKENELEVLVKKHSDNESVSKAERQADFWIFGGIFRPVYLEAKPLSNIRRVAIDAKADGTFDADVWTSSVRKANGHIAVSIKTSDGRQVAGESFPLTDKTLRLHLKVDNPDTWTTEFPNLYVAEFVLQTGNGAQHRFEQKFGFRTVEVRESDGIYVNGSRIKMKGVDRHTFHPKYGRTSSKELAIEAVNLIKDMNMNAVRMSHYPPDVCFLDVCDSLGLFVLDELTAWQKPSYDDVVGRKLLEEMIARDVNHPSIILWDNGNEGGENNNLNDDFAELDIQQRKVLHPWQDYDLTNTIHYNGYDYLALDGFSRRKVFFPTELLHGLYDGGHGAGLDDYWLRMWNEPLCAGGFLWVFADESVERTDRNGELDSDGNHAPDGILGPYFEKEGSFYTIKEIWSPVFFEKKYINDEFNGVFQIENRYHYTDLNKCTIEYRYIKYPVDEPFKRLEPVLLAPGDKGRLKTPLPEDWKQYDALEIRITDPYNRELNTWSWALNKAASQLLVKSDEAAKMSGNGDELAIVSGNRKFIFDKSNGRLKSVTVGGAVIPLTDGPVILNSPHAIKDVTYSDSTITAIFDNGDCFEWIISGGLLSLEVRYSPDNNSLFTGVTFTLPEQNVAGMKWLGDGPYRVYKNRMKGARFGLWEKAYNNTVTGESGFVYPEFKGYHANLYRVDIQLNNAPDFRVYALSNDIFLRMLTPQEPKFPANTVMKYPEGDLSFLHGINAIGTKFWKAENLGPQSKPYSYNSQKIHGGKLIMKLVFDFR
ncbi:MAG: glycoside hydrolase family 2 [Tannerella sp.]|jgi:hypothetical protein|nr:glycoside hydrolase family 2 [Tannerella sp.]